MRGFIFIDFLIAAALLLTTATLAVGIASAASARLIGKFLYFQAMTAHNSLLIWHPASDGVAAQLWSQSIRYLPHATVESTSSAKLCWRYLRKLECYP